VKLEGKTVLGRPPEAVWDFLLDVERFSGCVPGVQEVKKLDERTFEGTISAAVGPITGAFNFRATIIDSVAPREMLARLDGTDTVTKSKLTGEIALTLQRLEAMQTELSYNAAVGIQGRLAILGDMILRATATLMVEEFIRRVRIEIESETRQS
jgi:carbon monoxide dehydrogenase subunit G